MTLKNHAHDPREPRWALCGAFGDTPMVEDPADVTCKHCLRKLGNLRSPTERLRAIEELHAPQRRFPELRFAPWCAACTTGIRTFSDDGPHEHRVAWPCPTAIAGGFIDPLSVR